MRKFTGIILGVIVTLLLLWGAVTVFADAEVDGMFNWYDPCGYTCYQWADGSGDCYPCYNCESPVPTPEECDDCEIPIPTPNPDPTPEPTKEACNRGIGNGSEDCDPGNSGGKPGSAGEDNE